MPEAVAAVATGVNLVFVNGQGLSLEEALRRSIIHNEDFLQNSVDGVLIRQYAEKHGIRNSDAELQLAADELRYQRGLESSEKLKQWIKSNHQTILSLQNSVDGMLLRNKVRASIAANEIAAYFAEHQLEFQSVDLYSIRLENADKAKEILSQINEGANFHTLAMEHSQDSDTAAKGGYAGNLKRAQMTGEVEAAVFKAKVGDVIGPVKTDKGFNLFKVAAIHKPEFEKAKDDVRFALFMQLLAKLRSDASISYEVLA